MAIILLPKSSKGPARRISRRYAIAILSIFMLVVPAVALYGGYLIGLDDVAAKKELFSASLRSDLDAQRQEIADAKQGAQENLNAMTLRLAELQSRVVRLDALGERLTEMANLDKGEFDFETVPGQGGPASASEALGEANLDDFLTSFDGLSKQLDDREQQLDVLESMLMTRDLEDEVFPAGFPARKGWLSSFFGIRTDPFTGRPARHEGVDVAGKLGTDILAVAAGVVTWAGKRSGYGNLVEINHGNGYVTRYGHNRDVVVQVGDTVKKGQVIAHMGSTGRSTGPHVHFEVRRNGRVVNPIKYVRSARR
jgi:murein DD-endopeptidase MepM/ murein hydrolase activator NlpD